MSDLIELGDVGKFINGRAFKPSDWADSGLPIIRIQNLTGSTNIWNRFQGKVDNRNLVIEGDILISWSASLGVYRWKGENAVLNQHIFKVVLNEEIDDKYFFYAASNALLEMKGRVHGSTMQHITKDEFDSLRILVPSLPEQQRIAATLERADHLRRTRRFARQTSDSFLQSVFLKMFGDVEDSEPVENLARSGKGAIRTGPFGSQLLHSEFSKQGEARVLGIDNAVSNRFEWGEPRFINAEKYQALKRYRVFPDDVLITIMATVGRCVVVPPSVGTAINTKHICCITLDQTRCLPIYLQAAFLHHPFVLRQLGVSGRGAIMPGLNMGIIKELEIPLPPIEKQREFAAIVRRFERFRAGQIEAERQANHLFETLLHQAFSTD